MFPPETTYIALTVRMTFQLCTTLEIFISIIDIEKCLLDTEASVNSILSFIVLSSCSGGIMRGKVQRLCTGTMQLLPLDGSMLLNFHLCQLCLLTWFEKAAYIVVRLHLGTSSINWFNRGLFLSQCRVLPCHSQSIAVLMYTKLLLVMPTANNVHTLRKIVDQNTQHDPDPVYETA